MKNKKLTLLTMAASAAALCAYRAFRGYGVFNRIRFANEHDAIERYLQAHYPYATYGTIVDTSNGYSTVVTNGGHKFHLHISKTSDGMYVFSEKTI